MIAPTNVASVRDYLGILRRGWITVLVSVAVAMAAGYYSQFYAAPKEYASQATAMVYTDSTPSVIGQYYADRAAMSRLFSYQTMLTGNLVLGRVISQLNLDMTPAELAAEIDSPPNPITSLMTITVTDADPQQAQDIAAATLQAVTDVAAELEASTSGTTLVTLLPVSEASPGAWVKPSLTTTLGVGGAVGLLVAVIILVARELLVDQTLKGRRQLERVVNEARVADADVREGAQS